MPEKFEAVNFQAKRLIMMRIMARSMNVSPEFTSRTRDHLGNEGTHLVGMRTAIARIGFRLLIARWLDRGSLGSSETGHRWLLGLNLSYPGCGFWGLFLTLMYVNAINNPV